MHAPVRAAVVIWCQVMLRTNLATRPFYNERIAQVALGVVAVLGLAILAAGVVRLVDLARRNGGLNARMDQAAEPPPILRPARPRRSAP